MSLQPGTCTPAAPFFNLCAAVDLCAGSSCRVPVTVVVSVHTRLSHLDNHMHSDCYLLPKPDCISTTPDARALLGWSHLEITRLVNWSSAVAV